MNLKVKKLNKKAILPTRAHKYDAGLDLYSIENSFVEVGEMREINYGIAVEIPQGYFGLLSLRSSMRRKGLVDSCGIIDSDYRGYLSHFVRNVGEKIVCVEKGDRIGQLILIPCLTYDAKWVNKLNNTERSKGGMGSSGR